MREAFEVAHQQVGKNIDVLVHGSCFMASLEAAHSVHEHYALLPDEARAPRWYAELAARIRVLDQTSNDLGFAFKTF